MWKEWYVWVGEKMKSTHFHWDTEIGWPYALFSGQSWPGFLYCLKYPGFGFVFLFSDRSVYKWLFMLDRSGQRHFKSNIHLLMCTHICIALTVLCRSHLLTHHDWSIMYNACLLLVRLLFDHYLQQVWKQSQNMDFFGQYRNPGQDVSGKKSTYDHLKCTSDRHYEATRGVVKQSSWHS